MSSSPSRVACLQANQGRPFKKAAHGRLFLVALGSFSPVVIPRLPVSRHTRAGLMKKATQRQLQKAALGAVFICRHPRVAYPQANQGRSFKKGSPRPAFLSHLGVRFFGVIPKLPFSRQTRAGLMKKATQRRLQKAAWGRFCLPSSPGCISPSKPGPAI